MVDNDLYSDDNGDRKKQQASRELELASLRIMMGNQSGRATLYRMLWQTQYFNNSFSPDPATHAYNSGRRSMGIWLVDELKQASKELFFQMLVENE